MKTAKLFYRIFLNQPGLLAELLPGIPPDCQFDYSDDLMEKLAVIRQESNLSTDDLTIDG